jgi:hypothetical protein
MVHARPNFMAQALNKDTKLDALIDPAYSGLILCGSNASKVLRSVRDFARKEWPLRGSPADAGT